MHTPPTPPSAPQDRSVLAEQLVHELIAMRDALTELSLSLKDWQFETDAAARAAAQAQAQAALDNLRTQSNTGTDPSEH